MGLTILDGEYKKAVVHMGLTILDGEYKKQSL